MVHVEPQRHETNDVNHRSPCALKGFLDEDCACLHGDDTLMTLYLGQLHLGPELDEVHYKERQDYHAEHIHVLRRPLHAGGVLADGVTLVASCAAVLNRQHRSPDNVDDEQKSQAHGGNQCIPVGAQELADHVVGRGPYKGYRVHHTVECDK